MQGSKIVEGANANEKPVLRYQAASILHRTTFQQFLSYRPMTPMPLFLASRTGRWNHRMEVYLRPWVCHDNNRTYVFVCNVFCVIYTDSYGVTTPWSWHTRFVPLHTMCVWCTYATGLGRCRNNLVRLSNFCTTPCAITVVPCQERCGYHRLDVFWYDATWSSPGIRTPSIGINSQHIYQLSYQLWTPSIVMPLQISVWIMSKHWQRNAYVMYLIPIRINIV